jgi:hypothetical protein
MSEIETKPIYQGKKNNFHIMILRAGQTPPFDWREHIYNRPTLRSAPRYTLYYKPIEETAAGGGTVGESVFNFDDLFEVLNNFDKSQNSSDSEDTRDGSQMSVGEPSGGKKKSKSRRTKRSKKSKGTRGRKYRK